MNYGLPDMQLPLRRGIALQGYLQIHYRGVMW